VRIVPVFITLALALSAVPASGQGFVLGGSAGPTVTDEGYSLAAGVGFSSASRVTFMINVERTHLSSRVETNDNVTSYFRGGTMTDVAAELRVSIFPAHRFGPYFLGGFAAGKWEGNVNDVFPNPVDDVVYAPFAGVGLQVPLGDRVRLFGDARAMLMFGEKADTIMGLGPIRAGVLFRF
jgi:hypothetical protein